MLSIVIKSTLHGKSVHISTGVHVFNDEWDDTDGLIINNPNANLLNKHIRQTIYNLETLEFAVILAGACLGFFMFNKYPAKVFMGDTGSLFLGGSVCAMALVLKLPLLLVVAGGVYVIETLSVIIQVASFKLTGKRVFKMSPLHHHFEMCGWSENKIVFTAVAISVVLGAIALIGGIKVG